MMSITKSIEYNMGYRKAINEIQIKLYDAINEYAEKGTEDCLGEDTVQKMCEVFKTMVYKACADLRY